MRYTYNFTIFSLLLFIVVQGFNQSHNMRLLGNWDNDSLSPNNGGFTYNEVFGFEMNGVEYGVIGSTQGTHIIDITNPNNLIEVDFVPGRYQGNVTHRDFDVRNGYLYMVCDQSTSSLQIADLSFLPDSVHVVYDDNSLIVRSHNIFIDSANDVLYSCGGSKLTGSNELRLIDISNPLNPTLIVDCADGIPWWTSNVGYVHDIYVRNHIAYTNDEDAMHIINFSNPLSPVLLGSITSYVDKGYNHSGYLSADDTTYVMCDETHGKRVKFMDVATPSTILVTDVLGTAIPNPTQIAHNPIIKNNYAYVSYYYDGVQVYDIEDKYNVSNAAYYDTYQGPNGTGGPGCWGVYPLLTSGKILASDRETGLYVLQHLTPPAIQFEVSNQTYFESAGIQKAYISLSNELDDPVNVTINVSSASTATPNFDYSSSSVFPKTITFAPGTFRDSIEFTLIDDLDPETIETLIFTLSSPINGKLGVNASDTIFIQDNEIVGLAEVDNNSFKLFPNPAIRGNKVSFDQVSKYVVLDVSGKIVLTGNAQNFSTETLSSGSYLVKYGNKTEKLIIR